MVPQTTTQSTPATTQVSQQPVAAKTPPTTSQPAVATTGMPEPKKSVFKKWWFWLIVVLVLVGLGVGGWSLFK